MQLSPEQLLSCWHFYYFWLYVIICGIHMSEILHTREMYFKLKWTSNRYLPTFWIIRNRVSVISFFVFFLQLLVYQILLHLWQILFLSDIFPTYKLTNEIPNGNHKHFPNSVKFFIIEKPSFMPTSLKAQLLQYTLPFTNSGQRLALLK